MAGRSPLHEIEEASGARFGTHFSRENVEDYGDPAKEYLAVRNECGALDLCHLGRLRAVGRDRVRYLHNMLSNDVKALKPGTGCHAALLSRQGHIESDLHVYAFAEGLWLECPLASSDSVLETLNRFIVGDVVTIENLADSLCILSLQGPLARGQMEMTVGCPLAETAPLEHRTIERASGKWVVVRRDRTGCDGYDIWLPREDAPGVWSQWASTGRIRPVGYVALNWLRTEAGIPWYGIDMTDRNLPMEMGLDAAISMTKGCYRGQEIVARITHRGRLDRKLAGVSVESPAVPASGAEVQSEHASVGIVTSAILSPRLGRPLALCILKTACLQPGTRVEVVCDGEACPGEVVDLPL